MVARVVATGSGGPIPSLTVLKCLPESSRPRLGVILRWSRLAFVALVSNALAQDAVGRFSSAELTKRTLERRAMDAAIWGMPIVSFDVMRQGFFRDAKAHYGDIMYWSRFSTWKNQTTTSNTSTRY